MHGKLIIEAFEKIKKEKIKEIGIPPSDTNCAKNLSVIISEESNFPYGDKSLRKLYKSAIKENDIEIKQPQVVNALCKYLGYQNYNDYVFKKSDENKKGNINQSVVLTDRFEYDNQVQKLFLFIKNNKISITISAISIITLLIIVSINQQRWMVWQENHYVKISFDSEKFKTGELKLFKEDRINNFKQIEPDCNTTFFKEDGSANLWYGKNVAGELEYFTDLALHPKTGKTLRPISKYMIEKYICKIP